jgi:hypothetical protein
MNPDWASQIFSKVKPENLDLAVDLRIAIQL